MNAEVIKIVGQVAGIGGLALGVLLFLFRDIIRKNIFPQLTKTQAYRLLSLIAVLVFLVALSGIGAWVYAGVVGGGRVGTGFINDGTMTGSPVTIAPPPSLPKGDAGAPRP